MKSAFFLPLLTLLACGPVSLPLAEEQCAERARLASGPRGEIAIGAGTGGVHSEVSIGISTDFLQRKDPQAVYESCVLQRAQQMPQRPYQAVTPR